MSKIDKAQVEHVAKLSRIKLTEEEKEKFTQELGAILDYVAELESAPTEGIEPISQIAGLKNIAREDEIQESLPNEKALENAPEKQDDYIKVKKIFE